MRDEILNETFSIFKLIIVAFIMLLINHLNNLFLIMNSHDKKDYPTLACSFTIPL